MQLHANAALGLAGRRRLVGLIEQGHSIRAAAAALSVAPATAHRWWHRWSGADPVARASGACLADRSSRPHRQPRRLSAAQEAPILAARAQTNLGPGRLAHICARARSTIYKVLARHGLARRAGGPRPLTRRYEWARPGALIHIDTARLARFALARAPHARTRRGRHPRQRGHGRDLRPRGRQRPQPLRLRRAARRRAGAAPVPASWPAPWPTSPSSASSRSRR